MLWYLYVLDYSTDVHVVYVVRTRDVGSFAINQKGSVQSVSIPKNQAARRALVGADGR